jgi:KDO2-lipid IV(A) lauroyltransferase|tara:strand:- start:1425 stop:2384 length:960 start_codon:yes stop_codon:yes gene_type:complete
MQASLHLIVVENLGYAAFFWLMRIKQRNITVQKLIPLLIKAIGHLPLPWGRYLGALSGNILWLLQGRAAKVTQTNLQLCLPAQEEAERKLLARASLIATGKTLFEAAQVWIKPHAWLETKVLTVVNEAIVIEAIGKGKGVMFLCPHLGNWEVTGPYICQRWGLTTMYAPSENAALDRLVLESREKAGSKLVPANLKGVIALIKTLKKGGCVGMLPDQVPDIRGGIYAPFYGQPALTMTLIHKLIDRTDCTAVMVLAKRVKGGFEMVFTKPDTAIYSADLLQSATALNRSIEDSVSNCVEQYQWEYKRFRKQPEGANKVY